MNVTLKESLLEEFKRELPVVISRKKLSQALGEMLSPRTLANMSSKALGPAEKVRIGRCLGYTRRSVLAWLAENLEIACEA